MLRAALFFFPLLLLALEPPAQFREHLVAAGLKGGYQVVVADMNRDGQPDIVALASGMPELVWLENPGWRRHVVAGDFNRMINVGARDLNGDGIPDFVLAHEFSNVAAKSLGIVSLLESRPGEDSGWKVVEIDRIPTAHRLRWADIRGGGEPVLVNAPLTGEQAVAPDFRDKAPLVYYDTETWTRNDIARSGTSAPPDEGVVHGLAVVDWDGDGRDEILTASFQGIHLFRLGAQGHWHKERIAAGDPSPWPKSGSSDVAVGKLGAMRFLAAIEPWHGNQVVVYRPSGRTWQRTPVDSSLVDGHTILTVDLNGDGLEEIVAGCRGGPKAVYVYYARDRLGKRWDKQPLDTGGIAAAACTVADLNRDKKPDIVCIGSATANVKWYENRGPAL